MLKPSGVQQVSREVVPPITANPCPLLKSIEVAIWALERLPTGTMGWGWGHVQTSG